MQKAAAGMHIYPDGASFALRSRVAELHGVDFVNTVVANGSSELIELLAHALLRPGTEVIADLLNKSRSPFNVNSFAQVGALVALDDTAHIARSVQMVNEGRRRYEEFFHSPWAGVCAQPY